MTNVTVEGKPARFTSEAGSYLSLSVGKDGRNIIGVGENAKAGRKGTSRIFGSMDIADYFVPLRSLASSIHTHPPAGTYRFRYLSTDMNPIQAIRGPSETDYDRAGNKFFRNVMVDDKYIYLYNNKYNLLIYRR